MDKEPVPKGVEEVRAPPLWHCHPIDTFFIEQLLLILTMPGNGSTWFCKRGYAKTCQQLRRIVCCEGCASKERDSLKAEMAMVMVKVGHSFAASCSRGKLRAHIILGAPGNMADGQCRNLWMELVRR